MYQFIGDATGTDGLDFQPLFAEYENNPGKWGGGGSVENQGPVVQSLSLS